MVCDVTGNSHHECATNLQQLEIEIEPTSCQQGAGKCQHLVESIPGRIKGSFESKTGSDSALAVRLIKCLVNEYFVLLIGTLKNEKHRWHAVPFLSS